MAEPAKSLFAQLPPATSERVRALLARFFALAAGTSFDYRDCSLGNLGFAGAYLEHSNDFNAAAATVAVVRWFPSGRSWFAWWPGEAS